MTANFILPLSLLGFALGFTGPGLLIAAIVAGLEQRRTAVIALLIAAGLSGAIGMTMIRIADGASASV